MIYVGLNGRTRRATSDIPVAGDEFPLGTTYLGSIWVSERPDSASTSASSNFIPTTSLVQTLTFRIVETASLLMTCVD